MPAFTEKLKEEIMNEVYQQMMMEQQEQHSASLQLASD